MNKRSILIAAGLLCGFGILGAALVGIAYEGTFARIEQNEREALLQQLAALLPAGSFDNDPLLDVLDIHAPQALGAEHTQVYRARRNGEVVAMVFSPVEASGYSGNIRLIIGVQADGKVSGVRVLAHKETPGLGDKIEIERSNWVHGFDGRSLGDPAADQWGVKRDGGIYDQFTGATITPRSIVAAVKATLGYFQTEREQLLQAAPTPVTAEESR